MDEDAKNKKEKRRKQNVQAAQKSYLAKKKEREMLVKRNTELMETQMKLLHDKSRLEDELSKLEYALKHMKHTFISCHSSISSTSAHKSPLLSNTVVIDDNTNILDLSSPIEICSPNSSMSSRSNSPVVDIFDQEPDTSVSKQSSVYDDDILDESSLGIGATQEVSVEPLSKLTSKDRRTRLGSYEQDDCVFLPTVKKAKLDKVAVNRQFRRCGTYAFKKQQSNGRYRKFLLHN